MSGDDGGVPTGPMLIDLAAGENATCAVLADHTVRCWGDNREGQLGDGTTTSSVRPVQVSGLTDAVSVSVGYELACAVRQDATAVCWGSDSNGKLGNGAAGDSRTPMAVEGLANVVEIEAGQTTACALLSDGTVWCWGRGGSLGNNTVTESQVPVQVVGLSNVAHISAAGHAGTSGSAHVCGVRTDGSAFCFGEGEDGQNGNDTLDDSRVPVEVMGIADATEIAAGLSHACAIRVSGTWCWGVGSQVGNGSIDRQRVPVQVTTTETFVELSAGFNHTCGRTAAGDVHCWGLNGRGQIGDGQPLVVSDMRPTPSRSDVDGAQLIAAGASHTCAFTSAGITYCWGDNEYGERGSGMPSSLDRSNVPTPVVW